MRGKQRLSASVDASVLLAAQAAVADGRASNVSAWVNDALRRQAEHDQRLRALDAFLETYEAKHGVVTNEEIREATHAARERALVVRGKAGRRSPGRRRKRGARAA